MKTILSKTNLYDSEEIITARKSIYYDHGYYVVKNFVDPKIARDISARWASGQYDEHFHDFIQNKDVTIHSPNYMLKKDDIPYWSYAMHIWNTPVDEQFHSICMEAQHIRNLIEGRAIFYGLQGHDRSILQYRLSRTLSDNTTVFPHADFMEEPRRDSMVDHTYDPRRCQMTLMLSTYGEDYKDGGFKLQDNQNKEMLMGRDVDAQIGDLVIWKYSNKHHVSGVAALHTNIGFSRVVFPMFDKEYVDVPA